MTTTKLSSRGQVIIPKPLRTARGWGSGQELTIIDTVYGVLLKPKSTFPKIRIENVASYLNYKGSPKTLEELKHAIKFWTNTRD